ncbi:MAG TPA: helix-turn-helix domain-containing protein, partial [Candidatus Paceibacterota bacterium]
YLSLKKAAELSTYHSDYLGRLVRNEKLRGQRFGIQWFIEKDSLLAFIGARRDSNEIDENTPKEADFTVKVEPSTISPLTIQDFLPKLVKKDSPLWESTLLGDLPAEAYPSGRRALAKAGESFSEAELPLGSSASPFAKQTFNFSIKRFLVPALAAFLLFSFGLFGESLALAGKSFVKNSKLAFENTLENISLSALFSPALPEFPQLSFPAGYSQALSFSFLTAPVSSFFSKISSFFRDAQDAFLTLLGVPGLEEELAVLPEPRLAGPTPPSPTLGVEEQQTPGVGGLQTPGVGLESELASLRRELNQLKSSGLSISSQLAAPSGAPIDLAAIDEKLQLANNAVLAQVASSLASIESRIQPVQPNPVAFFTIPNKTPEKTFSGISSGFGSFDAGLEVSGNFNAYGKVALGTNGKSVSITSSTWNITSAGAAS